MGALFRVPLVGFEGSTGRRISARRARRSPAIGARPVRGDDVRSRRGTTGSSSGRARDLRRAHDDPARARLRVPQCCDGRRDRALRVQTAGHPDRVLAACVGTAVEPAVARLDLEAGLLSNARHSSGASQASAMVVLPFSPRTVSVRVRACSFHDAPLVDPRLALEPAVVRRRDVLCAGCEDVERRSGRRAAGAVNTLSSTASRSSSVCMCSSERKGQITSGTRSVTGGSRRSPTRRSSSTPASAARRAQTSSMPREESTPITGMPSAAIGTAMRPVPTPSSTHRAARPACLLEVERHVLDDARAPRVVQLRYRVVTAQR